MESIEIKPANADALRNMAEQVQKLSEQYQAHVSALALANDVPQDWQWDSKNLRFVAPPASATNGNGNGHNGSEDDQTG
jgi:hypothetical protein